MLIFIPWSTKLFITLLSDPSSRWMREKVKYWWNLWRFRWHWCAIYVVITWDWVT